MIDMRKRLKSIGKIKTFVAFVNILAPLVMMFSGTLHISAVGSVWFSYLWFSLMRGRACSRCGLPESCSECRGYDEND
jgi:hypothetical protein